MLSLRLTKPPAPRRHSPRVFVGLFYAIALVATLLIPARSAVAQVSGDDYLSPETREQLYDALAGEFDALPNLSGIIKKVVKLVRPAVVHINAQKSERVAGRYARAETVEEAGSGVVIEVGGKYYVLTNWHVIRNAQPEDIHIELADRRELHPLRTLGHADSDVAVMEIQAPRLAAARLGNSDLVEIGDFVLAVGSPFALSHSITFGIISAKGRHDLELGEEVRFQDFMQTDAAINPGNSGGPLINLKGEVIGINTAIATNSGGNEGIGFSIPINMVMVIANQLIERGSVQRAFLGVTWHREFTPAQAIRLGLPSPQGAYIEKVTGGSPAEKSQIRPGDVILQFNNVRVQDGPHLMSLVSLSEVGKQVPVIVFRDRAAVRLAVVLGDCAQYANCR